MVARAPFLAHLEAVPAALLPEHANGPRPNRKNRSTLRHRHVCPVSRSSQSADVKSSFRKKAFQHPRITEWADVERNALRHVALGTVNLHKLSRRVS